MTEPNSPNDVAIQRSQAAVLLDNLVRRHLRVSDPRDPAAISKALRDRYGDDDQAMLQEAQGLPFFKGTRIDTVVATDSPVATELRQATEDVSRDLDSLLGDALVKEVFPELRGWSNQIRQAVLDGASAARFALDPWQRDQAMATRRLLGDYARVARCVGALTTGMNRSYRALARSLDEVSSVILVTIGDSIAQAGFGGGRFLLQAPASELQVRRDAVLNALRNLRGSSGASYGQSDWPWGLDALRQVTAQLDQTGLTDLRALFQEQYVAKALDDLIHWATRGSAEDLRALGATAQISLSRFRRLVLVTQSMPTTHAPTFATYLDAIHSFLDAFESNAGHRLLFIARPAIAHYGLHGTGGPDVGTDRLLELTRCRTRLAQLLDCYLGCSCGYGATRHMLMLDKVLYDVDRAIDLYAMSNKPDGNGPAEQRAAAYGVVIASLPNRATWLQDEPGADAGNKLDSLLDKLDQTKKCLWWGSTTFPGPFVGKTKALESMQQELYVQKDAEAQWENLVRTMAPFCFTFTSELGDTKVPLENKSARRARGTATDDAGAGGLLVPTQDLVQRAIITIEAELAGGGTVPTLNITIPAPVELGVSDVFTGTQDIADAIRSRPAAPGATGPSGAGASGATGPSGDGESGATGPSGDGESGTTGSGTVAMTHVEWERQARELYLGEARPRDFGKFIVYLPKSKEDQDTLRTLIEQQQPEGGSLDRIKKAIGQEQTPPINNINALKQLRHAVERWETQNRRSLVFICPDPKP